MRAIGLTIALSGFPNMSEPAVASVAGTCGALLGGAAGEECSTCLEDGRFVAQPHSDPDQTKHLFFHQEVVVDTSETMSRIVNCRAILLQ